MVKDNVYEIGQTYLRLDLIATDAFRDAFEEYLLYMGKIYAIKFYNKELSIDGFYFTVEFQGKARLRIFGKLAIAAVIG